jgi:tungstate transport system ATP-binding protein
MSGSLPLVLEDVSFVAGRRAIIDRITCEIAAGPRTVILGPNGAGKSVLMRLCHGLLAPTSGRVVCHGGTHRGERAQAMVFQRPVMLRRSALANIEYGLAVAGVPRAERAARARDVIAAVGLGDRAQQAARLLSGGEQQKLALARAWALAPQVLFLDEPTANLDPASTRAIETVIGEIAASGTKIVMTTHNLGQARRLADEILFLSEGRLVERAEVREFFSAPASAEAAAFIEGELP